MKPDLILYPSKFEASHAVSNWAQFHTSISPSISFSSTEGINNCIMASTILIALKHQGTNRPIERDLVSRVWLYFAVQKSFGAILRQTSLKERLCQINTALQLGPLKRPHLGYDRSFYIYLLYDSFLFPLLSSIRLKHTHRYPPKWLLKSGVQNFKPT